MKKISSFNRLLITFLFFIGLLIGFRIAYTGSLQHLFLSWNIFLAWIPYILSQYFSEYLRKAKWKQAVLFITWLLFFPNALYIVTDLIHIEDNKDIAVWYDAILLFASSFIGIMMAFVSLAKVESYLRNIFSRKVVTALVPIILFTASFGVYLGRFQRWNSWDVIQDPLALSMDILSNFISPVDNYRTWAITILFTGIYTMLYFFLKKLPQALSEERRG
ncbi:DUF1361 domain-containing protein [Ferruginibacter sp. HRS2-29]|uniref:DUF1361 domain-containing protein n=1 Tax=Ferruginibacter sp. HRS2-29 TaxID=2487334 RepID=UPI0020CE1C40|nr:DUF1361 domain-containing protein [Ferruginibacter sp. HRS2-29]MCP9751695.1 DUF1361 domain-containing protein [Ferruginibacter sp. HRS2-29]